MSDSHAARSRRGERFEVRVTTRSSRPGVEGSRDGRLIVRLSSPPVDGKANDELIRLLAAHFGVSRSAIEIVRGFTSRQKLIELTR